MFGRILDMPRNNVLSKLAFKEINILNKTDLPSCRVKVETET